jgi:tRNA A-37 threonylcarbamoyl transferase component Bud32
MQGSLGEKIGEGFSADIHAWAPGRVVKLFKVGFERRLAEHEAQMTRAAFAAGAPAPEVLDEVTVEGRFGFVLQRLDGPTLVQLLQTGAVGLEEAGSILATLYSSIHRTLPPLGVVPLLDFMRGALRRTGALPEPLATGVLGLAGRLPPGDGLCHSDLHAGNVIMTADGPRAIDWLSAVRSGGFLDLACCQVLLTELVPDGADPGRSHALNAAIQSNYARLAGLSEGAVTGAMQPYLPIARVFALLGPAGSSSHRARLIDRLEATLRTAAPDHRG